MLKGVLVIITGLIIFAAFLSWVDRQPDVKKLPAKVAFDTNGHDQVKEIEDRADEADRQKARAAYDTYLKVQQKRHDDSVRKERYHLTDVR